RPTCWRTARPISGRAPDALDQKVASPARFGQTGGVSSEHDAHLREAPVSRRPIYAGRLIRVFDDTVRLPDGRESHREVVEHPGAVTIVAIDASDRVVLVRQWRHPA